MATRAILLVALLLFNCVVRADEPILPGSTVKTGEAAAYADEIFIGKLVQHGFVGLRAKGRRCYFHNEVEVSGFIRGSDSTQVDVTFWVVDAVQERSPREGPSYIFFTSSELPKEITAIKILPATDGNLAKVKALIAQKPKN